MGLHLAKFAYRSLAFLDQFYLITPTHQRNGTGQVTDGVKFFT